MREILFRGKCVDNGEWIEGYLANFKCYLDERVFTVIIPTDVTLYPHSEIESWAEVDPETVGQWTGLLDKNGNKIFEGDIILVEEHKPIVNGVYKVSYCDVNQCWCLERDPVIHLRAFFTFSDLNCFWETSKVIGNIHDNPELINR